jgi:hypothetical protein
MRKQLFVLNSPLIDTGDGPSSSILLDGAAGDYFKSKNAWLPQKAGAHNNDAHANFTISWWAKNTKPEGNANADDLWTIFAVASDETDVSGNLVANHDNKGFSLHCIDEDDGNGYKIRLHIRNESWLGTTTGNNRARGDTQVYSYDVVPEDNDEYNSGFPFTDTAGRFNELFNDGEWHLYEVSLSTGDFSTTDDLPTYNVQFTVDNTEIRFSNVKVRFTETPNSTPENYYWDWEEPTPSIVRYPFSRASGLMPSYQRLWMGTLYGDDGDDAGTGAMSMQLYSILYGAGYTDGFPFGWRDEFDEEGANAFAHGATDFPNNSFNGHYYYEDGTAGGFKIPGDYTFDHENNRLEGGSLSNMKTVSQWWRPGLDANNIGKDYIEFLGGFDGEGRVALGGGEYDESNAIRYSNFEVHGMTAASIRRDAPGGYGDDSSIIMDGTDSAYFKSAASLSTGAAATLIWWAKNTTREGDADTDGLWTIFSLGTGLGDRNSVSMHCDDDDHTSLRIWSNSGGGDDSIMILHFDNIVVHEDGSTTDIGRFDEFFNDGEWHMYAVSWNTSGGEMSFPTGDFQFSIDGIGIPRQGGADPGGFTYPVDFTFSRPDYSTAPRLWMGTNFGGASAGDGSMSMQLYSIVYAEGFTSVADLREHAYRLNGNVVDNHWPAFNSERFTGGFGRTKIPPLNWWRPGYDEDNIGKDYEGSADFDLFGIADSDIVRDYPKPPVDGPYSSVLMDGTRKDVIWRDFDHDSGTYAINTIIWWAKNTTPAGTAASGEIDHTIWSFGDSLGAKNSFSIGRTDGNIIISIFNNWATAAEKEERVIQYDDAWDEHFEDGQWHMYAVSIDVALDGSTLLDVKSVKFTVDGVLISPDSGEITEAQEFSRGNHDSPELFIGNGFGSQAGPSPWDGAMSMQLYSLIHCISTVTPTDLLTGGADPIPTGVTWPGAYNGGIPDNDAPFGSFDFPKINNIIGGFYPSYSRATNWLRPGFDKDDMFKDHRNWSGGHGGDDFLILDSPGSDGPTASDIRNDWPGSYGYP